MLSSNLLPEKDRMPFRYEQWRRFALIAGAGLHAVLFAGILFLLPSYFPALFQQNEFSRLLALEESAFRSQATRGARVQVQAVQSLLSSLRVQENVVQPLPPALEGILAEAKKHSLALVSVNIQKNGSVSLIGRADTRSELLKFEGGLRASGMFRDFASPLSNIIRERDVSFTIQGMLADAPR